MTLSQPGLFEILSQKISQAKTKEWLLLLEIHFILIKQKMLCIFFSIHTQKPNQNPFKWKVGEQLQELKYIHIELHTQHWSLLHRGIFQMEEQSGKENWENSHHCGNNDYHRAWEKNLKGSWIFVQMFLSFGFLQPVCFSAVILHLSFLAYKLILKWMWEMFFCGVKKRRVCLTTVPRIYENFKHAFKVIQCIYHIMIK